MQLFHRNSCKMSVSDSSFTRRGGLVRPASKSFRFSHHPLRVPKAWHGDFAACGQRSGLLALNLANIFEKLLDQKTFYFACGSIFATNPNHKKEDSRPFLRVGYLLLRMFVLHQKHREWTFRTISPTEAYFPGISPKISMAEKTFDTILSHSAKPLLTASHQSMLAFQFQPAVLDGSIP